MGCQICADERLPQIDAALLKGTVRAAALKFGYSKDMVGRHRVKHLAGQIEYLRKERNQSRDEFETVEKAVKRRDKSVVQQPVRMIRDT